MQTFRRTALAAATAILACLPLTPAAAAGPLFIPWAVGHVIGAAARLATLPLVIASAATAGAPPPYGAAPAYYANTPGYNMAPGPYYAASVYDRQPGSYSPRGYYPTPTPYYPAGPRYSPAALYRPSAGAWGRFPEPRRGYSAPGMRYAGSYGGQVFGRSRGSTYRRR